jgi:hypothetical protein
VIAPGAFRLSVQAESNPTNVSKGLLRRNRYYIFFCPGVAILLPANSKLPDRFLSRPRSENPGCPTVASHSLCDFAPSPSKRGSLSVEETTIRVSPQATPVMALAARQTATPTPPLTVHPPAPPPEKLANPQPSRRRHAHARTRSPSASHPPSAPPPKRSIRSATPHPPAQAAPPHS